MRRRLASPPEDHAREAGKALDAAGRYAGWAVGAVSRGRCVDALDYLADANRHAGKADAHRQAGADSFAVRSQRTRVEDEVQSARNAVRARCVVAKGERAVAGLRRGRGRRRGLGDFGWRP